MDIFNEIVNMFSYDFINKAFIVGILVSICSALLGVSLVLKRYAMIGDGLSHSAFGIISVVAAINTIPFFEDSFKLDPLVSTMIITIIIAIILLKMSSNSKINSDSAIALVSTTFLTIGIIVVSFTSGLNTDVHSILFGSILALTTSDVVMTIILSLIVLVLFIFFYHKIFAVTFDETFSRATGVRVDLYMILLAVLTAITIVMGMQIIGTLLISSLLVIPALTAIRLFKTFKSVMISAVITSVISFILGMIVSYIFNLPTGATVVLINLLFYLIVTIVDSIKKT